MDEESRIPVNASEPPSAQESNKVMLLIRRVGARHPEITAFARNHKWLLIASIALILLALVVVANKLWLDANNPTKRSFIRDDLIGCWRRNEGDGDIVMTVCLKADGTFDQCIRYNSNPPLLQSGRWTPETLYNADGCVNFSKALQEQGVGSFSVKQDVSWFVIDSRHTRSGFALSGSVVPDPDNFEEMTQISPAEADCQDKS